MPLNDEYEERELTEEERRVLAKFKENDDQLEQIASKILPGLNELADKTSRQKVAIQRIGEQLDKANDQAEKTEETLRLQNNELKNLLNKY